MQLSSSGTMAPAVVRGRLQLINVSFAYPSRPSVKVLSGLTLDIEPGQVVALVGPSGGGNGLPLLVAVSALAVLLTSPHSLWDEVEKWRVHYTSVE